MKNNHVTEMLPDYLDGLLKAEAKQKVAAHLKECKTCSQEVTALEKLYNAFKTEEISVPNKTIRTKFFAQVDEEKKSLSKVVSLEVKSPPKRSPWSINLMKLAASVVLLIGTFLAGKYQSDINTNKEIASLTEEKLAFKQTAMMTLLENESASKRIQGVNYFEEFLNLDDTIIKALTDRMLYDNNTNVRLTAVEALGNFTSSDTVKNAFIEALKMEKDPSIQITIIHILVDIQEKKAIEPMRRLLRQEETQPFIKNQIESLLPSII